jgi:DNA-binding IclR family transcriptional regulator
LGEPGYDILIAIFIADAERRPLRVADLAVVAGVPASTALRWVRTLEELDLVIQIERYPHIDEQFVELRPEGLKQMSRHLDHARRTSRS